MTTGKVDRFGWGALKLAAARVRSLAGGSQEPSGPDAAVSGAAAEQELRRETAWNGICERRSELNRRRVEEVRTRAEERRRRTTEEYQLAARERRQTQA